MSPDTPTFARLPALLCILGAVLVCSVLTIALVNLRPAPISPALADLQASTARLARSIDAQHAATDAFGAALDRALSAPPSR